MTTLNEIRSHGPCQDGWTKLLAHLGKTKADDGPLSLLTVLQSNGLDDALWCLRTEATSERTRRFALACARRVEHLHPAAKACNGITEQYLAGVATKAELDATDYTTRAATYAIKAAANAALAAAEAAAYAADYAAAAADAAVYAVADRAAACAAYAVEREAQTKLFMEIFA